MTDASHWDELRAAANAYHKRNPMVWALFERFSLEMWRAGRSHYGAKGVMERVRWETVAGGGDPFKISNDHVAFYARRFMRDHPEVGSFFRLKEQTSANRAPIGGE